MKEELKKIVDDIKNNNIEQSVHDDVDNAKSEYVYDWEDDFDSLEEAYEEQGRGEAESQTLDTLVRNHGGSDLSTDDHCEILEELKDHYNVFY